MQEFTFINDTEKQSFAIMAKYSERLLEVSDDLEMNHLPVDGHQEIMAACARMGMTDARLAYFFGCIMQAYLNIMTFEQDDTNRTLKMLSIERMTQLLHSFPMMLS